MQNEPTVLLIAAGCKQRGTVQVSNLVSRQAEALRTNGWEVDVGIVDSRLSPLGVLRNIRRLRAWCRSYPPRLIHAQYGAMIGYVGTAIASRRIPLVVSYCGDDLLGTPNTGIHWRIREFLARQLSLYAAGRADRIIVKSDNLAEALPSQVGPKICVAPNGVPLDDFRLTDRDAARESFGWTGKRVVLFNLSSSGNTNVKNPALARAAVELARCEIDSLVLHEMTSCPPQEVVRRMNAADCLLVTSLHEGSPNVVKEAMACNLPVVSVDCGDVRQRIESTYPSYVCGYDAAELAASLIDLLRSNRRSNGREQLKKQGLDDATIARRITTVYEQALGRKMACAA